MAEDEGRFGRIDRPRRCWAPKPLRPRVPRPIIRESIYVFAAVCPWLGRLSALVLPRADTAMMALFLQHLAQEFQDSFLILVLDRAGWHHAKQLAVPRNIRLLPQPAYSPELNPVEHLWEELREKTLANRSVASLDGLIDTLCDGLREIATDRPRLRSMTDFPSLRINTS